MGAQETEQTFTNRFLEMLKQLWQKNSVIVVFVIIILLAGLAAPRFLQPNNLLNILRNTSIIGVIALGMTFVIIGGGIDLSSGPVLASAGAVLIFLQRMVAETGDPLLPLWLPILAALGVATLLGFINGFIITKAALPPFIVTLAVGIIARSVVMYFTRGATIMGNRVPEFTGIGNGSVASIPIPFIIAMGLFALLHLVLTRSKMGTYVYAVGGNEDAARYSGIKADRIKIFTYMLVGLCAGIAATIEMSRMAAVSGTSSGRLYEFEAITAVIIGGTTLSGGKGRLVGTIVGFILLGIVNNMMIMLNISPYLSGAVKGGVILFAVLIQRRER
ncbi:MAG: ABC transporter permease [Spirochaetales bacterium]|nr:ABC transporter permease [Spirochaetales bacterium]MCF7939005.1 ABC transporter permease [Spirochaetales bacterium]